MSLHEELEAQAEHGRWVSMMLTPPKEWPKDPPRARFRDCHNCPERESCMSEWQRRDLCADCPYAELPNGLTERAIAAIDLADEPTEVIALIADSLSVQDRRDLQAVRIWRASRMMGGGF